MANKVSDSDPSVYVVENVTETTYTLEQIDAEIAVLTANINSYNERLAYLNSLRSEMTSAFELAAVEKVVEA